METIKEEPAEVGCSLAGASDGVLYIKDENNYLEDREEDARDHECPQSSTNFLVKSEPPIISESSHGPRLSEAVKGGDMEPPDPSNRLYTAKCELICAALNEEHGYSMPPRSTTAVPSASPGDEHFEFVAIEGIKQELPWSRDLRQADPNPFRGLGKADRSIPQPPGHTMEKKDHARIMPRKRRKCDCYSDLLHFWEDTAAKELHLEERQEDIEKDKLQLERERFEMDREERRTRLEMEKIQEEINKKEREARMEYVKTQQDLMTLLLQSLVNKNN